MSAYRKKPVVIDAVQWAPDMSIDGVVMVTDGLGGKSAFIKTLEGDMKVGPGDWVITGVKGEKYPCKDDIFRATYEPA